LRKAYAANSHFLQAIQPPDSLFVKITPDKLAGREFNQVFLPGDRTVVLAQQFDFKPVRSWLGLLY